MNKVDWRVIIACIVSITILEIFALSQGINGTIFAMVIAIMAGIAGWSVPQLKTN